MEFFEADGSLRRLGGPETEEGKNIQTVVDAILENKDFMKYAGEFNLTTDEYHNYVQSEIDYNKKRDSTLFNAIAFYPGVGPFLSTLGQAASDSAYENGPKGTLTSALFNFGPGGLGKIKKLKKGADVLGNLLTGDSTRKAMTSDPSGNHANEYVAQYAPYGGSQIFYGEDKYFIKDGDVYVKVAVKNREGEYVGVVEAYLSKEQLGDPMEIKVLWYYGKPL